MSAFGVLSVVLLGRLRARAGLSAVNVLDHSPRSLPELRTTTGAHEAVWIETAQGSVSMEIIGGPLRFAESLAMPVNVMAQGSARSDDTTALVARADALLAEVLAELSDQNSWSESAEVAAFDHWSVIPASVEWRTGPIGDAADAFAAMATLTVNLVARRSY